MATFLKVNDCEFGGRLTTDPEAVKTDNGATYCKFSLAIDELFTPQDKDKQTIFVNLIVWGKSAEYFANNTSKGDQILCTAEYKPNTYRKQDGTTGYGNTFVVKQDGVQIITSKKWDAKIAAPKADAPKADAPKAAAQANTDSFAEMDDDGDLPF